MQTINFNSFAAVAAGTVDVERGILSGCSVMTQGVVKGWGMLVDQAALVSFLAAARAFPNGVKIKMNHGSGLGSIVGRMRNFRIAGSKLLGDLHLLSNAPLRERVLEMATVMPESFGLSVAFSGDPEVIANQS